MFCLVWLLFLKQFAASFHIDVCETAFSYENCHQNVPLTKSRTYPKIAAGQRMFFKITGYTTNGVLWPYKCHVSTSAEPDEQPKQRTIIQHGCPVFGGMAMYMTMRPVKVEFMLSEIVEEATGPSRLHCLVVECNDDEDSPRKCPSLRHCENVTFAANFTADWAWFARPARTPGFLVLNVDNP